MIQIIARQYGVHFTDNEVSFDDKSNWIKQNPFFFFSLVWLSKLWSPLQTCVILYLPINELKYTSESIDELDVGESGPPEHSIAPSTEEHILQSIAEGSEQLTEVSEQDLQDNQNILSPSSLHIRFESSATKEEVPPEQYRQYIRELNEI